MKVKKRVNMANNKETATFVVSHIGMDTVELDGKHFTANVEQEQEVKAGDALISFDIEAIKAAGYSVVTPIVVTNHDDFKQVANESSQYLEFGNDMLTVVK